MLCAKFGANCLGGVQKSRFATYQKLAKKKTVNGIGHGLYHELHQNSVCVDIRFLNARQSVRELLAKTRYSLS